MFTLYDAQDPLVLDGYWVKGKEYILWGYVAKITANPKLQQVKIVLTRETSTWVSVSKSSGSWNFWREVVSIENVSDCY